MPSSKQKTKTCPAIRRYIFPSRALETMQSWFGSAGGLGVEDVAIATGFPTSDGDAVVTSLLHPNADRAPGWYEQRDGVEWDALYAFARPFAMFYLLQIHTHPPGYSTRHSPRDDAGAFVDRIGFLSLVLPNFALHGIDLHGAQTTVHERTKKGWRVWPNAEAQKRLIIVPSELDLQRGTHQADDSR
jgi:hypothetical protein